MDSKHVHRGVMQVCTLQHKDKVLQLRNTSDAYICVCKKVTLIIVSFFLCGGGEVLKRNQPANVAK